MLSMFPFLETAAWVILKLSLKEASQQKHEKGSVLALIIKWRKHAV